MSDRPLIKCQCGLWPESDPCRRDATEEDLLCDECRPGCTSYKTGGFVPGYTGKGLIGHFRASVSAP